MPKVRRERTKYHVPARKGLEIEDCNDHAAEGVTSGELSSKKDRRKQRRDDWLRKLGAIHSQQQRALEAEKRAKTVVVGDMMPLADALEEVDALTSKPRPNKAKPSSQQIGTRKHRQKELQSESSRFHQVLRHPAFKKDAFGALSEHLKNTGE